MICKSGVWNFVVGIFKGSNLSLRQFGVLPQENLEIWSALRVILFSAYLGLVVIYNFPHIFTIFS